MVEENKHTPEITEQPVIDIKGLYKSFGELDVLKGVDFRLLKGENIAVLGKSGTGKSVLIKILVGLLKPDKGYVNVLGHEIDQLNAKEMDLLRLRIGFSFQNSALYDSMNVFQNLAFPLTMNFKKLSKAEVKDEVMDSLEAVGLADKAKQMPAGLSGGQRKRIGIARTLILKPEIMLYDEPTSGLDPVTCTEINELIVEMQERYHTSAIVITHDLTCAKTTSQKVAMLIDGSFTESTGFEDLFKKENPQIKSFYNYNFTK